MAVAPDGRVIVVYEGTADQRLFYVSGYLNAEGELVGQEFSLTEGDARRGYTPSISIDAAGRVVVVYRGTDELKLWYVSGLIDGTGRIVGEEFSLTEGDARRGFGPAVAFDRSGRVVVVYEGTDGRRLFYVSGVLDGAGRIIGPEFSLTEGDARRGSNPTVAFDDSESIVILYEGRGVQCMNGITHRFVEANGIRIHIAEQGAGPLVVLCHGFPESWYSWRHQLPALAEAGFHAVAPDMRGYGQTDRPMAIDQYTLLHLVGDMVGLLDALGVESAVIAGHDWGAPVAWHAALLRPDRFRAVIGLSVPFRPRVPVRPTTVMPRTDQAVFYQLYFQEPGVAEAELERDVRGAIRRLLYSASGDVPRRDATIASPDAVGMVPRRGGFLSGLVEPKVLPSWLTEADIDFYAAEFTRTGFRGGLNWYRNIDRNWELLAPYAGARVTVPALYVAGDRDLVVAFRGMDQLLPNLTKFVPRLRKTLMVPGCGHWTQQERPKDVNAAMLDFLREL